ALDGDGDLWMTDFPGIVRVGRKDFPASPPTGYGPQNGLKQDTYDALIADRDQNIWFGGWGSGLYRLSEKNDVALQLPNELLGFSDAAGHFWLQHAMGLWECRKDRGGSWSTTDHLLVPRSGSPTLLAVRSDSRGRAWMLYKDSTIRCDSIIASEQ